MKLNITISGKTRTGKSTISLLLKKTLEEAGFTVEFSEEFKNEMGNDLNRRHVDQIRAIDSLKESGLVIRLNTVQEQRESSK